MKKYDKCVFLSISPLFKFYFIILIINKNLSIKISIKLIVCSYLNMESVLKKRFWIT